MRRIGRTLAGHRGRRGLEVEGRTEPQLRQGVVPVIVVGEYAELAKPPEQALFAFNDSQPAPGAGLHAYIALPAFDRPLRIHKLATTGGRTDTHWGILTRAEWDGLTLNSQAERETDINGAAVPRGWATQHVRTNHWFRGGILTGQLPSGFSQWPDFNQVTDIFFDMSLNEVLFLAHPTENTNIDLTVVAREYGEE